MQWQRGWLTKLKHVIKLTKLEKLEHGIRRVKVKRVITKYTNGWGRWRDAVADMIPEPRSALKYSNCFPAEDAN
jgi:hypothetical protein